MQYVIERSAALCHVHTICSHNPIWPRPARAPGAFLAQGQPLIGSATRNLAPGPGPSWWVTANPLLPSCTPDLKQPAGQQARRGLRPAVATQDEVHGRRDATALPGAGRPERQGNQVATSPEHGVTGQGEGDPLPLRRHVQVVKGGHRADGRLEAAHAHCPASARNAAPPCPHDRTVCPRRSA